MFTKFLGQEVPVSELLPELIERIDVILPRQPFLFLLQLCEPALQFVTRMSHNILANGSYSGWSSHHGLHLQQCLDELQYLCQLSPGRSKGYIQQTRHMDKWLRGP